jgi:hypothetical protein
MKRRRAPISDLTLKWDRKLAASGFVDVEDRQSGMLRSWTGSRAYFGERQQSQGQSQRLAHSSSTLSKQHAAAYYRLAGLFLHSHPFHTAEGRQLWQLHAEGVAVRRIAAMTGKPAIRVRRIIRRLKARMLRQAEPRWLAACGFKGEP